MTLIKNYVDGVLAVFTMWTERLIPMDSTISKR